MHQYAQQLAPVGSAFVVIAVLVLTVYFVSTKRYAGVILPLAIIIAAALLIGTPYRMTWWLGTLAAGILIGWFAQPDEKKSWSEN
jgi:hypothetical protein